MFNALGYYKLRNTNRGLAQFETPSRYTSSARGPRRNDRTLKGSMAVDVGGGRVAVADSKSTPRRRHSLLNRPMPPTVVVPGLAQLQVLLLQQPAILHILTQAELIWALRSEPPPAENLNV
jgi:hypothetical protein